MPSTLSPGIARLLCNLMMLFSLSMPVVAQQAVSRLTIPIDEQQRLVLKGNVHPQARTANDQGTVSPSLPMNRMLLLLKRGDTQEAALQTAIRAMHDPASPAFHQWLSPQQFASLYGPSDADIAVITGWLTGHGFKAIRVAQGKGTIEFSGNAEQVASTFHTSIHAYSVAGKPHIANATDPSIPQALAPVVAGILSLNNFEKPAPAIVKGRMKISVDAEGRKALVPDLNLTDGAHAVGPGDLWTIYNSAPLITAKTNPIDGAGETIAIAGRSDLSLDDITGFRHNFFPAPYSSTVPFKQINNGPDPGINGDDAVEQALDVEYSSAMAPGANIDLVVSASTNTTDGVDLSTAYIVDNNLAAAMSTSYGECEALLGAGNQFYNSIWEQAAAQGITATVSAGDNGSAGCDVVGPSGNDAIAYVADEGLEVSGLASTPYNVAVGGNEFTNDTTTYWSPSSANTPAPLTTALSYIPEAVWNQSCSPLVCGNAFSDIAAGSGGKSGCFNPTLDSAGNITACSGGYAQPDWQAGVTGLPTDGARHLPDVALAASSNDGYAVCFGGSCDSGGVYIVGGTSASSPSFAGVMALVNQKTGSRQGQANYTLYRLASNEYGTPATPNTANLSACNATNGNTIGAQCIFQDVTTGTNAVPCDGGTLNCSSTTPGVYGTLTGWAAGVGYDNATGLGSVNIANLVNHWNDATRTATSTTLTLGATSSTFGQPIPITVAVTPASGTATPAGNVSLVTDSGLGAGFITLTNGGYKGNFSALPGGTYHVLAQYAGDEQFSSSVSAPVAITVRPARSKTALSFAASDAVTGASFAAGVVPYGSVVTATATLSGVAGQAAPTGQVAFEQGSTVLATVGSDATGVATYNSRGYAIGSYSWSAAYAGNANYLASTSPAAAFTVSAAPTSLRLLSTTSYVVGTNSATLTAIVLDDSFLANPTGTISFSVNGKQVGSGTLAAYVDPSSGTSEAEATFTLAASLLHPGANTITATYSGDENYLAATSSALPIGYSVTAPANTIALATSANALAVEQRVTLIATVTTGGIPATSGTVNFFDGATRIATAQVAGSNAAKGITPGTAVLHTLLAPGSHSLKAVYTGILAAPTAVTSPAVAITVTGETRSTIALSAAADAANPTNYDLTALVSGYGFALPANSVDFSETSVLADFGTLALNPATLAHTFTAPAYRAAPGGTTPAYAVTADLNGDGIPDLATSDSISGYSGMTVLLGNGDGTYRPGTNYPTTSNTADPIQTGDFNGDGIVDLALTSQFNSDYSGGTVSIFLGNGDGTFQPEIAYTTPGFAVSTVAGDFNRDGILDVAVLQFYPMQISVAFGNGDGTFGPSVNYPVGYDDFSAYSIATADFNGDGALDLVEINQQDESAEVFLNSGSGVFSLSVNLQTDLGPQWVTTADLNGDGKKDVVTSNYGANTVGIFLGKGDGTFQPQVSYPVDGYAINLAVADLNGDGKLDIAGSYYVPQNLAPTTEIGVIYGKGDGTFGPVTDFPTGQAHGTFVVPVDLNGDGTPDLINLDGSYGDSSSKTIATLLNVTQASALKSNVTAFGAAGTQQQLVASYDGDAHYNSSSSAGVSVLSYGTRQTPAIAWTPVTAWGIGVALGTEVLNASVTTEIPGVFTYTAQLGKGAAIPVTPTSALNTGGSYTFTATFTPADTTSYKTVTATRTISIVPVDFTLRTNTSALTLAPGKTGTLTASVTGLYGFSGQVALGTAGMLPGGITVTASPASLEPGGKSTITITAPSLPATGPRSSPGAGCGSPVACVWLTSSSSTAAQGAPVTLQASIKTPSRAPATVTFYNGAMQLGAPVAVSQNTATLEITTLPAGLNQLTAIYNIDKQEPGISSDTLSEFITGTATVQILGSSGSIQHTSSVEVTIQ